jgi:hypothetical protein
MTDPNNITPPPELVQGWEAEYMNRQWDAGACGINAYVATQAAQWGADQELEACCKWTAIVGGADALRAARRPKPPSLKEQAMELARPAGTEGAHVTFGPEELALIRRALEQLDD